MEKIVYFSELNIVDGVIHYDPRDKYDLWRHHRYGSQAIGQAVIDLLGGITKEESFAIASHINPGLLKNRAPGSIYETIHVRMEHHEGYLTPFYFLPSDNNRLEGAVLGSSVAASNPAIFAAVLADDLCRVRWRHKGEYVCIFRTTVLPEGYDPDWYARETVDK